MWRIVLIVNYFTWIPQAYGAGGNLSYQEFTTARDEIGPMEIDDNAQTEAIVTGMLPDSFGEMFNFLDGDSFGIGPMHDFVYGWQAIVSTMSMKNNVEVRKRAGLQRFALAGINGITLVSHIGVTEIMINGTRTYCFGGVSRPPGRRNVICKGAMYQEGRFSCKIPYLRYPTSTGYKYCIDKYAAVTSVDGTYKTTFCARGEAIPKFHYDYICERREIHIRQVNLTDPNERFNHRNPIVRRAEYYRAPYDILKSCPDWYGCNLRIAPEMLHQEIPLELFQTNDTAFVGHGGKYWLALYYTQLSTYAIYFQAHAEYPWQSNRPIISSDKGGIWEQILRANIGPDMNLHYNLNGIYNLNGMNNHAPDLLKNDGEVLPSNIRTDNRGDAAEDTIVGNVPNIDGEPSNQGAHQGGQYRFIHDSQVQGSFQHQQNLS